MKGYGITLRPMVPGLLTFVQLARETEDAGFGGVYIPEAVNDALMCSLAVANATKRNDIATCIVRDCGRNGAGRGARALHFGAGRQSSAGAGSARHRDGQCARPLAPRH